MTEVKLMLGDCLDKMKELPDNSVDSIVTDPPYGLGDNLYKRVNKAVWKSFNIMLPNFYESDIKRIQYSDFSFKSSMCSDLSRCETIPIIKSRVSMPESPIYFDGNVEVREIEIDRSTVSSSFHIPDTILRDKFDANGSKFIGNFIFDFGNSIDFTADDVFSGNFGQFSYGFFSVPISSIFSSCFPNSGMDFPFPIFRDGVPDIVWGSDNMGDDSFAHSFTLTENGTEDVPVLTFDLTRASDYSSAAITTLKSNTFSNFIRPKIVRTNLAASSLSTVLQPVRVGFILDTANGTSSEYFLHLYVPKNLLKSVSDIYTNSSGFMGKKWDYDVPTTEIWQECLRVLKPGGHLLAFAGTRTQHRMAVNIEDAGFEIRDMVTYLYDTNTTAQQLFESLTPEQMKLFDATFGRDGMVGWGYGSGFPKSLDISKAIDKMSGAEREIISETKTNSGGMAHISKTNAEHGFRPNAYTGNSEDKSAKNVIQITAPATDEAKKWNGWGTALKPALEPITVARKPLSENTVAANVLKYGTGGINIDESRVDLNGTKKTSGGCAGSTALHNGGITERAKVDDSVGRFPANLIHDGSEEVTELFPKTGSGNNKGVYSYAGNEYDNKDTSMFNGDKPQSPSNYNDEGSAARFFYCAKTSKKDRNEGLENLPDKEWKHEGAAVPERANRPFIPSKNNHPTVKPTELMRYLVKLVTPPNGTVLDPFMGSGSTGKAAKLEGFDFIGIELDPEYIEIAKARIEAVQKKTTLDNFFSDDA